MTALRTSPTPHKRSILVPMTEITARLSTVYLAQDIKHEQQVAVKVLKPELAAVLGAEPAHPAVRFVTRPR